MIEFGCSKLSVAVLTRNRKDLTRLINAGKSVDNTESEPYPPLCFAIKWPAGMEILLKAGANPSSAIHCAIAFEDDVSIKMLLERGSCLFTPLVTSKTKSFWNSNKLHCDSILGYALWHSRGRAKFNSNILPLIVQALARSRQSLMELAKRNVPIPILKRLGWKDPNDDCTLLDSAANAVFHYLKYQKVEVSDFVWPGSHRTIYHIEWMTTDVMKNLFSAGFKETDIEDSQGLTPLLLHCSFQGLAHCNEQLQNLLWLLTHGAKRVIFAKYYSISISQRLAAEVTRGMSHEYINLLKKEATPYEVHLPPLLKQLRPLLPLDYRDHCDCFCSSGGCTPMQSLLKGFNDRNRHGSIKDPESYRIWPDRMELVDLWNRCSPSTQDLDFNYREACHFEIFSRLGMRHTCCKFTHSHDCHDDNEIALGHGYALALQNFDDKADLLDEDRQSKAQLDCIMQTYRDLEIQFGARFEVFWSSWWEIIEDFIPSEVWVHDGRRFVRQESELLPIYESELVSKLADIRQRVSTGMLRYYDQEMGID